MASKKQLKDDICFIVKELVSECLAYAMFVPNVDLKAVEDLVNDLLAFNSQTIAEINATRHADKKERGDNLKAIRNGLNQQVSDFVGRMAKLSEKA